MTDRRNIKEIVEEERGDVYDTVYRASEINGTDQPNPTFGGDAK